MIPHIFSGLSVASITPFNTDFSIDKVAYEKHLNYLLDGGVDHLVICGTTGESPTFSDDEYTYLIQTAVKIAQGRGSVIAGSGSNDTYKSIHRSKMAQDLGANGLLLVTPYYNKPGQKALIAHFTAIADAVQIPIMLYNVPGRTSVNMLPETTAELAKHKNIVAVKEASNDMQQILKVMELVPKNFAVLAGDDAMAMPVILSGGHGLVSVIGNEIPALTKSYVQACMSQNISEAQTLHFKLQPLMRYNFVESNPAPVKAALSLMGHIQNVVRMPLMPLSEQYIPELKRLLNEVGAL
jgi:4-hydroxy-tetrahydrodipicolinate synthase